MPAATFSYSERDTIGSMLAQSDRVELVEVEPLPDGVHVTVHGAPTDCRRVIADTVFTLGLSMILDEITLTSVSAKIIRDGTLHRLIPLMHS